MFRDQAFWKNTGNTKKTEGQKGKGKKTSLLREVQELHFTKRLVYDTSEN